MISFPFDSRITGTDEAGLPIYDRASNSYDLARWFKSFFTNGIFATSGFAVSISGLNVSVAPGDCLIEGRYGYEENTRSFTLAGGGTKPRIDSIVLRLDLSLDKRNIDIHVKTGTAAANPVAPALTRNDIMWELGIADISVSAGATSINQSAVSDTRLNSSRCGIVAQAMKTIDTTTYYNQIKADLLSFKQNEQAAFETWFESVKDILNDEAVGNLQNLVDANRQSIASLNNAMATKVGVKTATASLPASGWSNNRQTVSVSGVTASNIVIVTAAPASYEHYNECAVRCSAQTSGKLTFACTDKPTANLTANVLILE